jgi:IS5 family transposase
MKLTTRCGPAAVNGCNEALLAKAAEAKLLRTTRLRADTTVVPADVAYPTDSGLLAKAVRRIAAAGRRVQAAGGLPELWTIGPQGDGLVRGHVLRNRSLQAIASREPVQRCLSRISVPRQRLHPPTPLTRRRRECR